MKKRLLICSAALALVLTGCGKDSSGSGRRTNAGRTTVETTTTQTTETTTEKITDDIKTTAIPENSSTEDTEGSSTEETNSNSDGGYYLVKRVRDLGEFGGTSNYSYNFDKGEMVVDDLYFVSNLRHPELDMMDSYGGEQLYLFAPDDVCPLLTRYISESWEYNMKYDDEGRLIYSKIINLEYLNSSEFDYSYSSDGKCHSFGGDELTVDIDYDDKGKLTRYHMYASEDYVDVNFNYDNNGRITKYSGNAWSTDRLIQFEYDDENHIVYVDNGSYIEALFYDKNGLCFKTVRGDTSEVVLYDYIYVSSDGTIKGEYTAEDMEAAFTGKVDTSRISGEQIADKTEATTNTERTEEITTEIVNDGGMTYEEAASSVNEKRWRIFLRRNGAYYSLSPAQYHVTFFASNNGRILCESVNDDADFEGIFQKENENGTPVKVKNGDEIVIFAGEPNIIFGKINGSIGYTSDFFLYDDGDGKKDVVFVSDLWGNRHETLADKTILKINGIGLDECDFLKNGYVRKEEILGGYTYKEVSFPWFEKPTKITVSYYKDYLEQTEELEANNRVLFSDEAKGIDDYQVAPEGYSYFTIEGLEPGLYFLHIETEYISDVYTRCLIEVVE